MTHRPVLLDRKGRPVLPRLRIQHNQCCACWRLKHRDGSPHGQPLPPLDDHSTGLCRECLAKVLARAA